MCRSRLRDGVFSIMWQRQRHLHSRIFFLFWQLLHMFLATADALCSRGFWIVSQCFCGRAYETS